MTRVPLPLAQVALSALNHVLQQQPAAREQMRAHVGRHLRIIVNSPLGDVRSDAQIGKDGLLSVTTDAVPAVVLTLATTVDAVFGALSAGPMGLAPHLKVEGDVMLAAAVGEVAKSLRWDFEEDLSRIVGDSIAYRIGQAVRGVQARAGGVQTRSREALRRAAAAQDGPLVSEADLVGFSGEIERLSSSVARLEARCAGAPRYASGPRSSDPLRSGA